MPIRIQCPSPECGAACSAADAASGRTVTCPKCGKPYVAHPTFDGQPSDTKRSRPSANENPFPALPAEFGRYRVLRLLGRGGMGAVYLAADSQLEREVALKIPFFGASESPQRVERFVREARSAAALDHPNICTVFDAGQIDGRPFITMAHVAGAPLDREIDPDAPMPQARAARVAHKVAAALEHAHRKGVVHRDLKPANVMIGPGGEPVVMDFGLAKRAADADPNEAKITRAGGILGTPSYMSPEQVRGDHAAIGPASDVYSLGVMLFEMLTGRTPYSGSVGVVMGQILAAPVPSVKEFRPDVDPRLDAICRAAMAKDAAARFPTMAAFAARLAEYLKPPAAPRSVVRDNVAVELVEESPAPRVRPAAGSPFDALTAAPDDEATPARTPKKPARKRPAVIASAVAAVLLVGGLATVVFRVETPNGTLVVELNDAEVEARIKNGKVVLTGPDGKVRYTLSAGERDKKIDAGPYKVKVEGADGLVLDTPEFTLKKGDTVTVRVTATPKAVSKKDTRGPDPPSPGVPPAVAVADRKAFVAKGGEWRIDGDELVQSKSELATLLFGDPAWTDYDFTFETMTEGKAGESAGSGVGVFRARDADNLYSLLMGGYNGTWTEVNRWENGRWHRDVPSVVKAFPVNKWHKFHVRVRGDKIVCTIDGEKVFDFAEGTFGAGRVGLRTWNGPIRFRKVTVTAPDGVVLWDGLPDVAASNPPAAPKAGGFEAGTVWKGTRTYTKAYYNGVTVTYELHVKKRDGGTFAGVKFDNQANRNPVVVEGTIVGDTITWTEPAGTSILRVQGALANDTIKLKIGIGPATGETVPFAEGELRNDAAVAKKDAPAEKKAAAPADDTADFLRPENWEGRADIWKLQANAITGETKVDPKYNTCLVSKKKYTDFELTCKVRLTDGAGNSGVQIRSTRIDADGPTNTQPYRVHGPQVDAGKGYWGSLYGEGTAMIQAADPEKIKKAVNEAGWNEYKIVARGAKVTIAINGVTMVDDSFPKLPADGVIAFQVHGKYPKMKVEFTDITFKDLSRVTKDVPADPFPDKSVWVNTGSVRQILTVTERKGETFRARFEVGAGIDRDVSGTVKGGKVLWLAKDVKAVKGNPGHDNEGTITGDVIDFVYRNPDGTGTPGAFQLRRKPGT